MMSVIDTEHMITRDPLIDGFTYDEMQVGHTAYFTKTITEHDVGTFAGVTGDFNPAHVNQTGAEAMNLPGRICHGALTAGLVSTALGTSYQCRDGEWITLTILAFDRYWKPFCEAMELPQSVMEDERFSTIRAAKVPENCDELCRILEEAFAKKDRAYWAERLNAADIAFEQSRHYSEIAADEQAIANHYVEPFTTQNGKTFMLPMSPVQFSVNEAVDSAPAPLLGEHNDEVLKGLGYSEAEIAMFRSEKAIG